MTFDYGVEPVSAGSFKNPSVGAHTARVRSIIHLGMFEETYNGTKKAPAPEAVIIFELKGDDDVDDQGTPLIIDKAFPIRLGDKATVAKIIKAVNPTAKGFDDLIGVACQVSVSGSKELNQDGTPKYVNFESIASIPNEFKKHVPELAVKGVGHCKFEDLTENAIMELHPIRFVADILMKSLNYKGSKAEGIINKIRETDPEFAIRKKKDDATKDTKETNQVTVNNPKPNESLDESEEF